MSEPDVQRNAKVRAGFVALGTSFHAWCKANGYDPHNARKAVLGTWKGPAANKILADIDHALAKASL